MRARFKFRLDCTDESLVGLFKESHWYVVDSDQQTQIIEEVRGSLDKSDTGHFDAAAKIVIKEALSESKGVISAEEVHVARLLNDSVYGLQQACERLALLLSDYGHTRRKTLDFSGPVQIVEIGRKLTIIEGTPIATSRERWKYSRKQKATEFWISIAMFSLFVLLLIATYPYDWRNAKDTVQVWRFSVMEKFIGSVAVTGLVSLVQLVIFHRSLRRHTIRWEIPGPPEMQEVRPGS